MTAYLNSARWVLTFQCECVNISFRQLDVSRHSPKSEWETNALWLQWLLVVRCLSSPCRPMGISCIDDYPDPLNEYFLGRRAAVFVSGVFVLASVIGSACTHNWQQLLGCRVLLGIERH